MSVCAGASLYYFSYLSGDEIKIVTTPPFPESVTEGDIRWEKGVYEFHVVCIPLNIYKAKKKIA